MVKKIRARDADHAVDGAESLAPQSAEPADFVDDADAQDELGPVEERAVEALAAEIDIPAGFRADSGRIAGETEDDQPSDGGRRDLAAAAPTRTAFEGRLDCVYADAIEGWAWIPAQPDERLVFEIVFDGDVVATVPANRPRKDLAGAGIGDGSYSFKWAPHPSVTPAGRCIVVVRRAGTNEQLGVPTPLRRRGTTGIGAAAQLLPKLDGRIEQAEPYRISGWCWCPDLPDERVLIEILLNDVKFETIRCDQYRKDLQDAGIGDGRHGFSWAPDSSLLLPGGYKVSIRRLGGAEELLSARMSYLPATLIDGAVALTEDGRLEGWVWNKLRRDQTISVGLFDGENLLLSAPADQYDAKLAAEGIGTGAHAFQLRLPAFYDAEPHELRLKALPSCVELAGSPLVIEPRVGRQTSLRPKLRNLDPEQTSRTLVEAVVNFSAHAPPPAVGDHDLYLRSCLDALAFLYASEKSAGSAPIVFPEFADPVVSIVIPVFNQFEYTWRCLKSVAVATWGLAFEVILIDDHSSDETSSLPQRVSGLRYIRQEQNRHFVLSCNGGARAARGKYLYFLNNDTELMPNAISALLQTFSDFPRAGVVGSKLIYPDGSLQEVGCLIWNNGEGHNFGRHERDQLLPQYQYVRECHYVSAASMLISRELFTKLGGFDERYVPAYSEDSDLCMSARAAGYQVLVQPASVVVHYERVSSGEKKEGRAANLMKQNKPKFVSKWGQMLAQHPRSGDGWDLARDIGVVRRCLFFDWRTPRIDEDAGSYAALQEMRVLQSLGVKVTFASLNMEYAGRHTEALQRVGIECVYAPYEPNWQTFIDRRGGEFDFVYGMRFETMEQVLDRMRSAMPQAKIIFNCADVHFLREIREAQLKEDLADNAAADQFAKAEGVKERELSVMRRSDGVIVYNDIERGVLQVSLPGKPVTVMPWIVPTRDSVPGWSARSGIAFLGSYQHTPNRDAVQFFAREVMPLIRKRAPDCVFYVYGSEMERMRPQLEDLAGDGVVVVGYVKTLSEMFDRHRVFVAPLRYGSGIKGKVVMGLCNGLPTVLTPVATEGMSLRNEQEVLIAQTQKEFAAAALDLHEDAARWSEVSKAAMSYGRRAFSKENARVAMRSAVLSAGIIV